MTKRKTEANPVHAALIREFVSDFRATGWTGVSDLSLARKLRTRQLRKPVLTAKLTRDLTGDATVRVLAAVWDELGNIFALLPTGKRLQYIGR